jgi:hypothetical protein
MFGIICVYQLSIVINVLINVLIVRKVDADFAAKIK